MHPKEYQKNFGFTLIELMITVAITALIITLVAPSMVDFIRIQRIKSIASEIAGDLHYARSETLRLKTPVFVNFNKNTCYTIVRNGSEESLAGEHCDCTAGEGNACKFAGIYFGNFDELKVVSINNSSGIAINASSTGTASGAGNKTVKYEPSSALPDPSDFILNVTVASDAKHSLLVSTNATGRPQICVPTGSSITGFHACE